MPKSRDSNKETRKKPLKTLMEKRAARKSKTESKPFMAHDDTSRR